MNKFLLTLLVIVSIVCHSKAQVEFSFGSDTLSLPGGTVDIDVNVSGFDNLVGIQLSINWDATVFSFVSIENVTDMLDGFSESNIGTHFIAAALEDGELTLLWDGPSTQPRSLPDDTHLFTIRLAGVGERCEETKLEISSTPREIQAFDVDFNILDVTSTGGNIAIRDSACPTGGGGGDALSFRIESVSAASGTSICIPVTADNFDDIWSFNSGITWDPDVLQFTGINDAGLTSVTANERDADQGQLLVLWTFDQSSVSLPDGWILFELCFNVVGNTEATTPVSFANLPGFDNEAVNSDGPVANIEFVNGVFTVGSDGGEQTGVGLIAPDLFTEGAGSICVPITTRNFVGVAAFNVAMGFDASVLTFTELRDGAITDTDVGIGGAANGELRILWQTDFSTPSVTVDDDAVLFELCFDVTGVEGERSEIGFISIQNFLNDFSNEEGQELDFFFDDGSVTVGDPPEGQVTISAGSITINRGATSCIDFTVSNFMDIQGMGFAIEWDASVISYAGQRNFNLNALGDSNFTEAPSTDNRVQVLWTPTEAQSVADGTSIFQMCFQAADPCGATTVSEISFVDGVTPIQIIDGNDNVVDPQLNSGSINIGNCDGSSNLVINVLDINDPSCIGSTNGLVSVEFENAVGTVMCVWVDDATGSDITTNCNLLASPAGSYTLTATDQDGNVATLPVTLMDPSEISVMGTVTNAACNVGGRIALSISGGTSTGSYTIQWSDGLPGDVVLSDLDIGTYTVTVTDDNSCEAVESFFVGSDVIAIDPIITDNSNPDMPNGSIDLNPDSGANLTYSWSTSATTSSISDLDAGTYTVTITNSDANCTESISFLVGASFVSGDMLITEIISRYNGFGVSCFGAEDGILEGEIIGGCSDGPVTVLLDGNTVNLPLMGISSGMHTLRLEDACGNVDEQTFVLEEPDEIIIADNPSISCPIAGSSNGSVAFDISGGTGIYSISSSVGNQSGALSLDNLPFGTFAVVVQDENGCQVMTDVVIDETDCGIVDNGCNAGSIITPNGDNVNDVFVIGCANTTTAQPNNLTVYDRWGKPVLRMTNYDNSWDGTDESGEPLPEGGYMWVLTTGGPGNRDLFRGTVSILR